MRVLILALITCLLVLPAQAQYSGGSGTADDPYQIATAVDLFALGNEPNDYGKSFILTADIDLNPSLPGRKVFDRAVIAPDANEVISGFDGAAFTGVFDGNGHTISHLTITGVSYLGLFGQLGSGAEVRDLGVLAVSIAGSGGEDIECAQIGGLVGLNGGTVTRCYSAGFVSGGASVGGLVGQNGMPGRRWGGLPGTIAQCYSVASVSGSEFVGGLMGRSLFGSVDHCYSMGSVSGAGSVGGLVADAWGSVTACVWDIEASGLSGSAAGAGLTTAEMMNADMLGLNGFADDPNWVLDADGDYPRLAWEGRPGSMIPGPDIDWLEGLGTAEEPYRIDMADQLILVGKASVLWDRHFVLAADIDLDPNLPDIPVFGQAVIPTFTGAFDGAGHTISNLIIVGQSHLGLFGYLAYEGEVRGLGVVDVNITGSGNYVAGLVATNDGTVTQCYSTGATSGDSLVGGLVGSNNNVLTDCYSTATVTGNEYVGGLVGSNNNVLTDCYSTGTVTGNEAVGGLSGISNAWLPVTACFWDIEASGQALSADGTGLTTAEMQARETFTEWGACGASSWTIDEGNDYPRLWWEMRAGQPLETWLFEFVAGDGTPEDPYLIHSLDDVDAITKFPCEQDKLFRLGFVRGMGTAEDPYVIDTAEDLDLLAQCPYEQDKRFQLGFVSGVGTQEDPYLIDTADDLDLLAQCPYEQDKHFQLGFVSGVGTQEDPYLIDTADDLDLLARCSYEQDKHFQLGFVAGQGTPEDPYLIATAEQLDLVGLAPYERDAHFLLMGDINLSGFDGKDSKPAFHVIDSFAGVFDGNGHTIVHLTIAGQSSVGFFGQLAAGAEVRDLGVVDVNIVGSRSHAGALVGRNLGSVIRCYSTGVVSGDEYVGGLLGENRGTVAHCYSTADTAGTSFVGGLAGWNSYIMTRCYSRGAVAGSWSVGGLLGSNYGAVTRCYSTATVTGAATAGRSVGGLVGWDSGIVNRCYSAGRVHGMDGYTGGLVGRGGLWAIQCLWDTQTSEQSESSGGIGRTTAQMQIATTFLNTGWDFVGETANGTEDTWRIDEGSDYPRFMWDSSHPHDGAREVSQPAILRWRPGQSGLQHDVYFGDEETAVVSATPATPEIYCGRQSAEMAAYQPGHLAWGKTYYWRIDNVDEADPGSPWKGIVWSFTTTDAIVSHEPADGATGVIQSPALSWTPGASGLQYDVYFGETSDSVANATIANEEIYLGRQTSETTTYTPSVLTRGTTYYWRIDAVDDVDPGVMWKGRVWSFTVADSCVTPDPIDGATGVVRSAVLSWTPGEPGLQYDVYLGQTSDSVADATIASEDVYRGRQASEATTYTPPGLEWGTIYYWRVDEVDAATDETVCKGQVWSFTVETYDRPIMPIEVTASSSNSEAAGPEKTIDGSGLDALDQHSTFVSQMWLSENGGDTPIWIQYEFDGVYTLSQMWVWNSNMIIEAFLGFGAKDVTVEYSLDGADWTTLGQVEFAQAPGMSRYTANTVVDFDDVPARFVRLTINRNWGGLIPQCSLSEVRFFYVP